MLPAQEVLAQIRPDDAFLVSYPRSGNTWARLVLSTTVLLERERALIGETGLLTGIGRVIPDLYVHGVDRNLQNRLGIRPVFKTHAWIGDSSNPKVFLFRRPEDVLVSYFHYARTWGHIGKEVHIDGFALGNLRQWISLCSVALGHLNRKDQPVLAVAYEDLHANPAGRFGAMIDWLGLPFTAQGLRTALRLHSFHRTKARATRAGKTEQSPMLQGRSGAGRAMLKPSSLEKISGETGVLYEGLLAAADRPMRTDSFKEVAELHPPPPSDGNFCRDSRK